MKHYYTVTAANREYDLFARNRAEAMKALGYWMLQDGELIAVSVFNPGYGWS